jgi:hypothetical protein
MPIGVPFEGDQGRISTLINQYMISHWEDVLPSAVEDLNPFQRQLVEYILALPGKKRTTYIHAKRTWDLNKHQFNHELHSAFSALKDALKRRGVHKLADLDMR